MRTTPCCGRRRPASVCSVSVLPLPLRPRIAVNSPGRNSVEKLGDQLTTRGDAAERVTATALRSAFGWRAGRSRSYWRVHPISAAVMWADDHARRAVRHLLLTLRDRALARHDFRESLGIARRRVRFGKPGRVDRRTPVRGSYLSVAPTVCSVSCAITMLLEPPCFAPRRRARAR